MLPTPLLLLLLTSLLLLAYLLLSLLSVLLLTPLLLLASLLVLLVRDAPVTSDVGGVPFNCLNCCWQLLLLVRDAPGKSAVAEVLSIAYCDYWRPFDLLSVAGLPSVAYIPAVATVLIDSSMFMMLLALPLLQQLASFRFLSPLL